MIRADKAELILILDQQLKTTKAAWSSRSTAGADSKMKALATNDLGGDTACRASVFKCAVVESTLDC